MHFTRYENNIKITDQDLKIMQAFHKNDKSYKDSVSLEEQLIKINNANIS